MENKPTKSILAQNILCIDGIIDLTDYGLPGVEANIKIGKNEKDDTVVILFGLFGPAFPSGVVAGAFYRKCRRFLINLTALFKLSWLNSALVLKKP